MRLPKFDSRQRLIVDIWQNSSSCAEAATALGMSTASLKWAIWKLRRQGCELKRFKPGARLDLSDSTCPTIA